LLGVELASAGESRLLASDAYCRGGDLVASYADARLRPNVVQIYWRVEPAPVGALAEIDLEVSVQTSLLDSDPAQWTCSRLPAGELFYTPLATSGFSPIGSETGAVELDKRSSPLDSAPASCWLVRLPETSVSYAEMVHPADFWVSRLHERTAGGERRLRHQLFVSRLEKGVILRARIRGVFVSRDDDCAQAAAAYRRFVESPPPLTT
jgi:hypothetical protein